MLRTLTSRPGGTRRGMVAAQVALSLTALIGVMALLVDGGLLLSERRHAQATADAAALAGASDLYEKWNTYAGTDPGSARASALNVAASNSYANDGTNSTVTINIPPVAGNFIGKAGYVEAIVTWKQKRGFSRIFSTANIPVSARAVARGVAAPGSSSSGLPGILLLDPSKTALTGVGNGTVDVTDPKGYTGTGGAIYVDSTGPTAVSLKGNADVSAPSIYIAQTGSAPSGVTATGGGGINMGATPLADPLSHIPAPTAANPPSGISVVSLPNGITGSTALASNTIYLVGGNGISLQGNATLTGTNVMLYLTGSNATINLNGNGAVNLTAMTTGPYQGIVLFQDRTDSNGGTLTGNGNLSITGTIYAPSADLTAVGNGTTNVFGSQIIANTLTVKGNGTVNVAYNPNTTANVSASVREFGLVE
jgi:Putative Flp pilus-assembly TadE/G-like